MSLAPNFVLTSDFERLRTRSLPVADPSVLNPTGAAPIVDGEFLELNSSYQLLRKAGGAEQVTPVFPVYLERGRYDAQAIGHTTVIWLGQFEAETAICDVTNCAVGDPLVVGDVNVAGVGNNLRGLKKAAGAGQHAIFGWVTRVVGTKLRFRATAGQPTYFTI